MTHVLFVCTGNTCRSPMAQGLFAHMVKGRGDFEVLSAGLGAVPGHLPCEHSIDVMAELGMDIRHQRSRTLTAELVRKADFIFVMTYHHLDSVLMLYPSASEKTFLLREFESDLSVAEREISDPIGQSLSVYRRCRDQIRGALNKVLEVVIRQSPQDSQERTVDSSADRIIAVASDSSSLDLKEVIAAWLSQLGYQILDQNSQASSLTDAIARVSQHVAEGKAGSGILIDSTAIGLCIAANKYPGVRAVAVFSSDMARLSRETHDANVICLAARDLRGKRVKDILEAWLHTSFRGAAPTTPSTPVISTPTMESKPNNLPPLSSLPAKPSLAEVDPEIASALKAEFSRQHENIELIASENFTSRAVMEAQGSCLTNKYAEGYPRKRWYGGCENADIVEDLAISRVKELFSARYANVQPHSGSQANAAVYFSFLQPGDLILTMDLSHGGHLTHGHKMNFSGRFYRVIHYGVNKETEQIDYDEVEQLAKHHRPKMITAGASAYSRIIDFQRMRQIADQVGAFLFVDMAHIAGLVAAGLHPSPLPYAHFVTSTTHKTLRGPRGGIILTNEEKYGKDLDSQVFPGVQGGPLMHVIAAKAVAFGEALRPEFKAYQEQVVRNAKALCEGMKKNGFRIVSGSTDNHLMLVDLMPKKITGKDVQELLDQAGITVNKNSIPFDTQSPFKSGGIRLGTPAVTTRGMKEDEMFDIANLIEDAVEHREDPKKILEVRDRVREITNRFPLPF